MQPLPYHALLNAVQGSPDAVARHDKTAWLQLFDHSVHVEDPVGSRPMTTQARLEQFYESFIAPNTIRFNPGRDYAGLDADGLYSVWRDLSLAIDLSADVTVTVPMHLHYQLRSTGQLGSDGDDYKVTRLAAHWALGPMIKQLFPYGLKAVSTGFSLSLNIGRNLGWYGLSGFGLALLTPTSSHELLLEEVLGAKQTVALQDSQRRALDQAVLTEYRAIKTISAGRFITATLFNGRDHALLVIARSHRWGEVTSAQLFANSDCVQVNCFA